MFDETKRGYMYARTAVKEAEVERARQSAGIAPEGMAHKGSS